MKKRMLQNVMSEVLENRAFRFYSIMWYPVPKNREFFAYMKKYEVEELDDGFSWIEKNKYMDEYISFLNKWWFLYRNFPFVKEIYLANSITFNSLSADSDIDIFVVCNQWRVWTARLFVSIIMLLFWIKRSKKNYSKKFCLSFFVWEDIVNLKDIQLDNKDIYLPYWILHLVPLYLQSWKSSVYSANNWINDYLPNYVWEQSIFLWNNVFKWNWFFKNFVEFLLWWKCWLFFENFLQKKWGHRIKKNIAKDPESHRWNICDEWMLKFYKDMRKYYSDLFFSSDN